MPSYAGVWSLSALVGPIGRGEWPSPPGTALFGGGNSPAGTSNVMDYVTIASTGNATDFGDLIGVNEGLAACSNGHGGLA